MAVRDDHELIQSGPYALVRHPAYTGWLLMLGGGFTLLLSRGSWFVESGLWESSIGRAVAYVTLGYSAFSTMNVMSRIGKEDAVLRKEFGMKWELYAKKTPYRLVPNLY